MNLARASEKIVSLTDEFARSIEVKMEIDAIESTVDRIFNDLLENRNRSPDGRRYSRDTLIWGRQPEDSGDEDAHRPMTRKNRPIPNPEKLCNNRGYEPHR
jgi:hypothetical protein